MNHKKFNLFLLRLIILIMFVSCKNDNSIIDENIDSNIEQSDSIKTAIEALKSHFNDNGSLNIDENPIGNIIFDYGFKFIYPNKFSYNNGSEVIVENYENLVNITVNITDSLFINGISFPFKVETFNNDAITIKTINNEPEFITLLENRRVIDDETCVCTLEYNPICVEIKDINNETFLMEFPNLCFAECEGFTEYDIINCDNSNPANNNYNNDCFEFIYPFSIININNEIININNETDFENALFLNYTFDFIYPFEITFGENSNQTITDESVLLDILLICDMAECWDNCPATYDPICVQFEQNGQLITLNYQNQCFAECDGFTEDDFVSCDDLYDCNDNCPSNYDPVCVEVTLNNLNNFQVIFQYQNFCNAECAGFTIGNIFSCN